ncbi:hypothetical protein Cgig2_030477 [Carnegiea gigantea]|uniref:RRM domain-containing protein n=1 Tax=Carnegiea gigantea TaxID=171969 RepID=A0A9Q1KQZ5_9CARY|nr:hypothetical protein Cgig2_030477 [Carnegiea gigantea]
MAFCSRVGSILKQSISQSSASPIMSSIRCMSSMSSTKLFVGGLSFGTDDGSLKDAFSSFGEVVDARVITDRDTGRSRGFGFVNFTDSESASSAMSAMDGQRFVLTSSEILQELNGRSIRVSLANERPPRPQFGGGGGGYGGGRGFGGGFQRSTGGYGGDVLVLRHGDFVLVMGFSCYAACNTSGNNIRLSSPYKSQVMFLRGTRGQKLSVLLSVFLACNICISPAGRPQKSVEFEFRFPAFWALPLLDSVCWVWRKHIHFHPII